MFSFLLLLCLHCLRFWDCMNCYWSFRLFVFAVCSVFDWFHWLICFFLLDWGLSFVCGRSYLFILFFTIVYVVGSLVMGCCSLLFCLKLICVVLVDLVVCFVYYFVDLILFLLFYCYESFNCFVDNFALMFGFTFWVWIVVLLCLGFALVAFCWCWLVFFCLDWLVVLFFMLEFAVLWLIDILYGFWLMCNWFVFGWNLDLRVDFIMYVCVTVNLGLLWYVLDIVDMYLDF